MRTATTCFIRRCGPIGTAIAAAALVLGVGLEARAQSFGEILDQFNKGLDTANKTIDTVDKVKRMAEGGEAAPAAPTQEQVAADQATAVDPLSKRDIVEMVVAGISPMVIVAAIKKRKCAFEVEPEEIILIKEAGFADEIITAMIENSVPEPGAAPAAAPTAAAAGRGAPVDPNLPPEQAEVQAVYGASLYDEWNKYEESSPEDAPTFGAFVYDRKKMQRDWGISMIMIFSLGFLGSGLGVGIGLQEASCYGHTCEVKDKFSIAAFAVLLPGFLTTLISGSVAWARGSRGMRKLERYSARDSSRPSLHFAGISPLVAPDGGAYGAGTGFSF
jgi:hypothetical protein